MGLNSWFSPVRSPPTGQGAAVETSDGSNIERERTIEEGQVRMEEPRPEGSSAFSASVNPSDDIWPQQSQGQSSAGSGSAHGSVLLHNLEALRHASGVNTSGVTESYSGHQEKLCLICLEPLTPEDFESEAAMVLQCQCKGDAALRHRECAQKWVDVKGDLICDICRTPIRNLDAPRQRSDAESRGLSDDAADGSRNGYPAAADVFDCIRMTWIVTIVCILFFKIKIPIALVAGILIATVYTWSCQILRCLQCGCRPDENTEEEMPEVPAAPNRHATIQHIVVV